MSVINGCSMSRSFIKQRLYHCNGFSLQPTGKITKLSPSTVSLHTFTLPDDKKDYLYNVNSTFHMLKQRLENRMTHGGNKMNLSLTWALIVKRQMHICINYNLKTEYGAYSRQFKRRCKVWLELQTLCLFSMLIHVCNSCNAVMGTWLQVGVWAKVPALLTEG